MDILSSKPFDYDESKLPHLHRSDVQTWVKFPQGTRWHLARSTPVVIAAAGVHFSLCGKRIPPITAELAPYENHQSYDPDECCKVCIP